MNDKRALSDLRLPPSSSLDRLLLLLQLSPLWFGQPPPPPPSARSRVQGVPSARGLGWVDLSFVCSTVCLILPGLMGIWQKGLGCWARWWKTQIKVNPTQVPEQMNHPVVAWRASLNLVAARSELGRAGLMLLWDNDNNDMQSRVGGKLY